MKRIRLAVLRQGIAHVTRNNVAFACAWADRLSMTARPFQAGLGKGSADLVGILKGSGRVVALEVKTPSGVVSPEQRQWLAALRRLGGFAAVVRSEAEALSAVLRAVSGANE